MFDRLNSPSFRTNYTANKDDNLQYASSSSFQAGALMQFSTLSYVNLTSTQIQIAPGASTTVDSSPTTSITASYGALDFVSDGSGNWMVM